MTFWHENYGFVKEVYDFRCSKYQEWMDNIEAIIGKVMANTQYTAKEFKIIKDTFTSLCRDLDKEGTKTWLDLMLDKLSSSSSGDGEENLSLRDKNLKVQEKKKLELMVERHKGLLVPTKEAQSKVDHYSECYAYGDDIHPIVKVLDEQLHLSTKEIHPHNMIMCEEQIDKQEKVIRAIENQAPIYQELIRRGAKLKSNPNAPTFLEKEISKLEEIYSLANEKSKIRLELLNGTYRDWNKYEQKRIDILVPLDALDEQYKSYRKIYDPKKGNDWLERKKKKAEELKKQIIELYENIQASFSVILELAGEEKKEFMEKDILEIDERKILLQKVDEKLEELSLFNRRLTKCIGTMAELRAWMMPACDKLKFITTATDLSPEERVKEIFDLQTQLQEKHPLLAPTGSELHDLLDVPENREEDGEEIAQMSETAMRHLEEYDAINQILTELNEKVELEASSVTQDQKFFAEYLYGVKNFKPWMEEAETIAKTPLIKPPTLEDALKMLENIKAFESGCTENRGNLDMAAGSRNKMEKQTKEDDEVMKLNGRWENVKQIADDRLNKVQLLCDTWDELQKLTQSLTNSITEIPGSATPDVATLEKTFNVFRELNDKKLKLLNGI